MLKHKKKEEIVAQVKPIIQKYGLTTFTVFTPRYIQYQDPFYITISTCQLKDPLDYLQLAREVKAIDLANIQITDASFIDYNNQYEMQRRAELVEDIANGEVYYA